MRKENEENPVVIKHININSLNLSGQLQVFSRFFWHQFFALPSVSHCFKEMDEFIYKYSRNMAPDMYNRELSNGSV